MTCMTAFAEEYDPNKYDVITSEHYDYTDTYTGISNPSYDYVDGAYSFSSSYSDEIRVLANDSNVIVNTTNHKEIKVTGPCVVKIMRPFTIGGFDPVIPWSLDDLQTSARAYVDPYSIIYFPSSAFDTTSPTVKITGKPNGWVSAEQGIKLAIAASDDETGIKSIKYKIN